MTEIEKFWKYARDASFHYADDSTKEWHLGDSAKAKALKIFDDNPELQDEIRANFSELWRLER